MAYAAASPLAPIAADQRIAAPDVLRAFALLAACRDWRRMAADAARRDLARRAAGRYGLNGAPARSLAAAPTCTTTHGKQIRLWPHLTST